MEMDVGYAGIFRYTILKELLCAFEAREELYNYVLMYFRVCYKVNKDDHFFVFFKQ